MLRLVVNFAIQMATGSHFRLSFDLSDDDTPTVVQIPVIEFALKEEGAVTPRKRVGFT